MRCDFCGREFDEQQGQTACHGCALFGGCKKVKCPWCGYEMPREPRLVKWIRSRRAKR